MKKNNTFGIDRVIQPKGFIPFVAWKMDNSPEIKEHEIRIRLKQIKFEEGNFRQLCNAYDYDEERIKECVLEMVTRRGKLHNVFTDSGGICCGTVEEIGKNFDNKQNLAVGDEVICLTSLTSIPVCIDKLGDINFNYEQVAAEGHAILFEANPIIKAPKGLTLECALYAFDEAGSIGKAKYLARDGKSFLVLGSSIMSILIYAAALRISAKKGSHIVAVLDRGSVDMLPRKDVDEILSQYVDSIYVVDILDSMETFSMIQSKEGGDEEGIFDISIICANLLGVEAISVLLTKERGTLFFTNLINNYNMALLFAESLGKHMRTISLEEYTQGFPQCTIKLLESMCPNLARVDRLYRNIDVISKLPVGVTELLKLNKSERIKDYVFASKKTEEMLKDALNISEFDCNVIIQGETGVGKEKVLELLHKNSRRKGNPCIKINCATISETLAESEFFGYEPGAFTGATSSGKKGYFEMANNGVLFLDEVGELSPAMQSKLLRVLQENQFYRVGGEVPVNVNVRVICAGNESLRSLVQAGKFREDLYYRLNICEIKIPPLRQRKEDIHCLGEFFLKRYNERYMQNKVFAQEAMKELEAHSWPGNVRELENTIHRAVVIGKRDVISGEEISKAIEGNLYGKSCGENDHEADAFNPGELHSDNMNFKNIMENHEKALIEDVLEKEGTTRKAAVALGISQSQLMRKKAKYKI